MAQPHRLPPHDLAAEQAVLGSLLLRGDNQMPALAAILKVEDFYHRHHGRIYGVMRELYDQGHPVDEVTVASRLQDNGSLTETGGRSFLAELADAASGFWNVEYYAQLVREKAQLRAFIEAAQSAMEAAYRLQADPELALEEAEKTIFAASQSRTNQTLTPLNEVLQSSLMLVEQRYKQHGGLSGITTGFNDLDRLTTGLQRGDLIIIAGRPSMGKTAFALNMAASAALQAQAKTAIFSLEMSKEQLGLRLLSAEALVPGSKIRKGCLSLQHDFPALTAAADRLSQAPIYIDDTPAISVLELRAKARRLKNEQGLDLIVIDYLQLMRGRRESFDSREQEISDISRSLKALAKELSVPVVALSQLNRKVEERKDRRPMLSDLRESGAIEQDADVIAFIYRGYVYSNKPDDENKAELIIGKQRNGPTGTVYLAFISGLTKFENMVTEGDVAYEQEYMLQRDQEENFRQES